MHWRIEVNRPPRPRETPPMSISRRLASTVFALSLFVSFARAGEPASPLRLIPADTDLLVNVPDLRRATETVVGLELIRKLDAFSAYREALDSTNLRHFRQFLAYFEKEMDAPWHL